MTYRATSSIYAAPGALAYAAGDVVPDSAVKNLDIADKVTQDDTEHASPRARRPRKTKPAPQPAPAKADAEDQPADS